MKNVLITGGTGYVGSRVALSLATHGVSVIVVDIVPPQERGVVFPDGIEFRQTDLRSPQRHYRVLREPTSCYI